MDRVKTGFVIVMLSLTLFLVVDTIRTFVRENIVPPPDSFQQFISLPKDAQRYHDGSCVTWEVPYLKALPSKRGFFCRAGEYELGICNTAWPELPFEGYTTILGPVKVRGILRVTTTEKLYMLTDVVILTHLHIDDIIPPQIKLHPLNKVPKGENNESEEYPIEVPDLTPQKRSSKPHDLSV